MGVSLHQSLLSLDLSSLGLGVLGESDFLLDMLDFVVLMSDLMLDFFDFLGLFPFSDD